MLAVTSTGTSESVACLVTTTVRPHSSAGSFSGHYGIRLQAENATEDEVNAFVAVIAKAIQQDPGLTGRERADERAELPKILQAAFDQVPYSPASPALLTANVNFLRRVSF